MKLKLFQVDAFTSVPFAGNPAAIVPLDEWLPAETMLAIAAENNLAETAFFVGGNGKYDLRWFTPTVEMDLCGHATLASAFVLAEVLKTEAGEISFHTKSGELRVAREGRRFVLDFPSRPGTGCEAPAGLIEAIGVQPREILKSRDYMLVYDSEAAIRSIRPDFNALLKVDAHAVIVTAKGDTSDFASRFFAPAVGVPEDPATGSAYCTLIPYWAEKLGKNELFGRQVSQRGGELFCELVGDRVKIGGDAVLYLEGEIYVEAGAGALQLEIREAAPGDEQTVVRLLLEAFEPFRTLYTPGGFADTTASVDVVRGRLETGKIWLAFIGDEAVGTVTALPEESRVYIRSMAVTPRAQGRGIGQRLLETLEQNARELGFKKVYLYTTFVLPGAQPLYEKNGFVVTRETPAEEWHDMPGVEMEKELV